MGNQAESVLDFSFNNNHYSLPTTGLEDEVLHKTLRRIRMALNLSDSLSLKARVEPGQPFLDETLTLSEVLLMLTKDSNTSLEICVDNLGNMSGAPSSAKGKVRSIGSRSDFDVKRRPDGKMNLQVATTFERPVYHWETTYVLLPAYMLRQFQDHLKNDFMARWINRLCGSVLGASITIIVTLQNTNIHEMFRSNLKLALFFCVFCTIAFGLLEIFGRPRDRRSLEALIDSLLAGNDRQEQSSDSIEDSLE